MELGNGGTLLGSSGKDVESARIFFLRILSILIRSFSPPVAFHGDRPALLSSSSVITWVVLGI